MAEDGQKQNISVFLRFCSSQHKHALFTSFALAFKVLEIRFSLFLVLKKNLNFVFGFLMGRFKLAVAELLRV